MEPPRQRAPPVRPLNKIWIRYSRPGNSLTERFPLIVEALLGLRSRSCIIDGEAVCCDDMGVIASQYGCRQWNRRASAPRLFAP